MTTRVRWWLVLEVLLIAAIQSIGSDKVALPIGVISDEADSGLINAYRHGEDLFNERESRFKLTGVHQKASMENSFLVGNTVCRMLKDNTFAIFTRHSTPSRGVLTSYSSNLHLPIITTDDVSISGNSSSAQPYYEFHVRPNLVKTIMDVFERFNWREIHYFFSGPEGADRSVQFLEDINENGRNINLHFYRVQNADEVRRRLFLLDRHTRDNKYLLIDLPNDEVETFLKLMREYDRAPSHRFIMARLGVSDLSLAALRSTYLEVIGFQLFDARNATQTAGLNGGKSSQSTSQAGNSPHDRALVADAAIFIGTTISRVVKSNAFETTIKGGKLGSSEKADCDADPWQPWKPGQHVTKTMHELQVQGQFTGNIEFDRFGRRRNYTVDIVRAFDDKIEKIGMWRSDSGVQWMDSLPLKPKGYDPVGKNTKIITSIFEAPFLMIKEGEGLVGNDRFEGYAVDLAAMLASTIGFEYVILPVRDGKYGSQDSSGAWNGMVGELIRKEADLAIAGLTVTSSRKSVVDFSSPFMTSNIDVMLKKPMRDHGSVLFFMYPLTFEMWIFIALAYVAVTGIRYIIQRWNNHLAAKKPYSSLPGHRFSPPFLCSFDQAWINMKSGSIAGCIVSGFWWFFAFSILSIYVANFISMYTVKPEVTPIRTIEDLAKQTNIKYGVIRDGSTGDFFKRSTIPTYERMWAFMTSMEPSPFVRSFEEGIDRVRKSPGKFAFIGESTSIEYANQQAPCDTMSLGGKVSAGRAFAVATPFGSDLKDRINLAILEFNEKEDLHNLYRKWWLERGVCGSFRPEQPPSRTSSLKWVNVVGIWYTLFVGMAVVLVVAVVEFLYHSWMEAKRRQIPFRSAARDLAMSMLRSEKLSESSSPETDLPMCQPSTSGNTPGPAAVM